MFKERLSKLIIISSAFIAIISVVLIYASNQESVQSSKTEKTTDIIFIGNLANRANSVHNITDTLSLVKWDLMVFGGNTVNDEAKLDNLKDITKQNDRIKDVAFVTGISDPAELFNNNGETYHAEEIDSVLNIFLDTTITSDCRLNDPQLRFLTEQLDRSEPVKIIYMYDSIYANDKFFTEKGYNTSDCDNDYWRETIDPLIKNKVDAVISGDGEGFHAAEKDSIDYIQNGLPRYSEGKKASSNLLQFTRIQVSPDGLLINKVTLGDELNMDNAALDKLETYEVIIEQDQLLDLYNTLPFYNYDKEWNEQLEAPEKIAEIQTPIQGDITIDNDTYAGDLSIRGNVGNHWGNYKKSWDIQITSTDARQMKFIMPSDRHYLSQLFAEHLNNDLGVLTPHIDVVRLIINDIDMGPYLLYEDFDKAFVELSGYNSDADTSRSLFLETDFWLSVYDNANYIDKSGNSVDKTYQQKYIYNVNSADTITDYFDQDYTARWIAIQIFAGDNHQNQFDNNRFFIDKATGRYVMVTWDQWYLNFKSPDPLQYSLFQKAFYSVPENRDLVIHYVEKLITHEADHTLYLTNLLNQYDDIFINDPFLNKDEISIQNSGQVLLSTYDKNITLLTQFVADEKDSQ